jgi:hypothetical protein
VVGVVALTTLLLVGSSGCTDDGSGGASRAASARHDALWGNHLPPDVELREPHPLLPGPELPLHTTFVSAEPLPGYETAPATARYQAAQTLYADPSVDDPSEGRELVVGRTGTSDEAYGPAVHGDPVRIQGTKGEIKRGDDGDSWVVSWPIPVTDPDCPCDQFGVVAGRGLSKKAVVAAAEAAQPHAPRPTVSRTAVPDDLRSLGTVAGTDLADIGGEPRTRLTFAVGRTDVVVDNYAGDPRLGAHLRFWNGLGSDRLKEAHEVLGEVVVIDVNGPRHVAAGNLASALVRATKEKAADLQLQLLKRPQDTTDQCDVSRTPPGGPAFIAAYRDGFRWIVGFRELGRATDICVATIDDRTYERSERRSSAPLAPPTAIGEVSLVPGTVPSSRPGVRFVIGWVAPTADRVEVRLGDDRRVDATLGTYGDREDRRVFAAPFTGVPAGADLPVSALAYRDGREIGHSH